MHIVSALSESHQSWHQKQEPRFMVPTNSDRLVTIGMEDTTPGWFFEIQRGARYNGGGRGLVGARAPPMLSRMHVYKFSNHLHFKDN
jgi:hypothetical protein